MLVAARKHVRVTAPLTYSFESIAPRLQGTPMPTRLTVTLSSTAGGNTARVLINSDSTLTASEAIVGEDQTWVTVPFAGQSLELRFRERRGGVDGTWVLGIMNNGELHGTKSP